MLAGSAPMRNAPFVHNHGLAGKRCDEPQTYVCYFSVHGSILYKVEITFNS
jgi:hypothetical protein